MVVYRIESHNRKNLALTGEGARLFGGRWNRQGERAVYTSMHRSLAMLEILAHVFDSRSFPIKRVMVSVTIPSEYIHFIPLEELPLAWDSMSSYQHSESVFHEQCLSENRLAIAVPSVVVPEEYNVVINPHHESIASVVIEDISPIKWDTRIATGLSD